MRREAVPNGDTAELEGGQMGFAFNRWTIVEMARVSVLEIRVRSEKRGRNDGAIRKYPETHMRDSAEDCQLLVMILVAKDWTDSRDLMSVRR